MKKRLAALAGLIAALAFAGNAGAVHTGWFAPDGAAELKNPFAKNGSAAAEGKKIFEYNCLKCHGPAGKADGWSAGSLQIELPDFSNKDVTSVESDGEWFWKVKTGQFEMPPFQLILKDDEVWKAIVYIRTLAK
ncbi:MAG: hypothetical protein IEMM0002_0568 [bacterium]|nr:MAG: hypothetical protein IEMM0002_0568 [bacterium]